MIASSGSRAIGYDVRGQGPAVLLLHPFPFDRRFWDNVELPGFRVVTMDCRGFGESALGGEITIDDLADDAVALLDRLGIPMVAVVGSSMGGYVALSIAARHGGRLSALVMVGSRASADGEVARASRVASARHVSDHGAGSFLDGMAIRLCGRAARDEVRASVQALCESSSPDFARALPAMLLALGSRPDRTPLLATLRIPTLIVVGDRDAVTPSDEARAMKRAIPGAAIVELAGSGHLPSREVPSDFTRVVHGFLETTLASP